MVAALPVAAQVHTVQRVAIVAKPNHYRGSCPAEIEFIATIFVNRYPVWVEYQWERSDGGRGQRERVEITSAGRGVSTRWTLGAQGQNKVVWQKLHVLAPTGISSPAANVRIECR
jgi:hypothetical protein